jgi:hypothetical protein
LLSRSQRQSRSVGAAKRPSKNPKSSDQCFTCNSKEARCSILFPTSPHPTHEKEWSMHIPVPPKYTSDRGSEPTHITRQVDPNGLVSSGSCRRVLPKAQKSAVVWVFPMSFTHACGEKALTRSAFRRYCWHDKHFWTWPNYVA